MTKKQNTHDNKISVRVKNLEKSEVEITGELPEKDFEAYRKKALEKIGKDIEMPGFRKGHIPENILTKKVSEEAVLEEMAQQALGEIYPKILMENKIDAIGQPEISVTKLAKDNPFGFKIKTAIMPDIKLSDYKEIAKDKSALKEDIVITDEDVEKTVMQIRKMRAASATEGQKNSPSPEASEEHNKRTEGQKDGETEGQRNEETVEATKTKEQNQASSLKTNNEGLPELNDEFVKTLGDFKNVEDFKTKLKENIRLEKEVKARDKRRVTIIDAIVEKSSIDPPQLLVDIELDKMIHQLQGDLSTSGFTFEDYLKQIKKTEADIRIEWRKDAEKRVKFQLAINKIATEENIKADEKDIEQELSRIMEQYKGADPNRARALVEHTLVNEKVFQFLEKQGGD